MTEPEVSKTVEEKTVSVTRPASVSAPTTSASTISASTRSAMTSSAPANSSSVTGFAAQYFLVATPSADVAGINAFLGKIAPKSGGSYAPVFAANGVDGGFWTANLSSDGADAASSRSDISIVAKYTNTPASYPTWTPSMFSDTATVDLEILSASTLSPSETAAAKIRRKTPDEGSGSDSGSSYHRAAHNESAEMSVKNKVQGREPDRIVKRDPGIRDVRQRFSPKDLSVLSWAPGVSSVDNVDYIFSERKGENTWVYVLDTGINSGHAVGSPPFQWQTTTDIA